MTGPKVTMDSTGTIGDAASEMYRMVAGRDLDEWQRTMLGEMLTRGPDGKWTTPEVRAGLDARPLLEARALAGLFLLDENVVWSTARAEATKEAFGRLRALIEGAEALRLQVRRCSAANGQQAIELRNGHRLRFMTRTRSSGRGLSTDCHIADEWLDARTDPHVLTDIKLSMVARRNPQLVTAA
jgi:hypothetical protein